LTAASVIRARQAVNNYVPVTLFNNYAPVTLLCLSLYCLSLYCLSLYLLFDKETGEGLWKHKLPAGGYATPCVYEIEGRQYVVIACGGGKMGTPSGDAYVAFALPIRQDGP
jgi:quinoprotein glucose dehydrogenase